MDDNPLVQVSIPLKRPLYFFDSIVIGKEIENNNNSNNNNKNNNNNSQKNKIDGNKDDNKDNEENNSNNNAQMATKRWRIEECMREDNWKVAFVLVQRK